MRVGVLAVQGDFEAHAKVLERLDVPYVFVTHPKHLSGIQGLILPGGESTTMLKFLQEDYFLEAIKDYALEGRGLFGTCAGAILLSKEVINPSQTSLGLMDVTIERNAYGRQMASHIGVGESLNKTTEMIFIRAPKITRTGEGVETFATYKGEAVGVIQDRLMLTTFHPELSHDNSVHQLFLDLL